MVFDPVFARSQNIHEPSPQRFPMLHGIARPPHAVLILKVLLHNQEPKVHVHLLFFAFCIIDFFSFNYFLLFSRVRTAVFHVRHAMRSFELFSQTDVLHNFRGRNFTLRHFQQTFVVCRFTPPAQARNTITPVDFQVFSSSSCFLRKNVVYCFCKYLSAAV